MAKSRKFEAVAPDGSIFKRSSQNREYRFAVAYKDDYSTELMYAIQLSPTDASNYEFHVKMAAGGYNSRGLWLAPRNAEELARHKAEIEGHDGPNSYCNAKLAKRRAAVEAKKAAGGFDKWRCAGWQSRYDLAVKIANGLQHSVILEAREV